MLGVPSPMKQCPDKGPKLTIQLNRDAITLQNQGKNTPTQNKKENVFVPPKPRPNHLHTHLIHGVNPT